MTVIPRARRRRGGRSSGTSGSGSSHRRGRGGPGTFPPLVVVAVFAAAASLCRRLGGPIPEIEAFAAGRYGVRVGGTMIRPSAAARTAASAVVRWSVGCRGLRSPSSSFASVPIAFRSSPYTHPDRPLARPAAVVALQIHRPVPLSVRRGCGPSHPPSRLFSSSDSSPNVESERIDDETSSEAVSEFFADPNVHPTFESIGVKSPTLLKRLKRIAGLDKPSAVQAASYDAISSGEDVTVAAETGSGKTLAYLIPLIDDVLQRKAAASSASSSEVGDGDDYLGYDYARAIILVPNKELSHQVARMASDLCGGPSCLIWSAGGAARRESTFGEDEPSPSPEATNREVDEKDLVRIAIMPGGLSSPKDFRPFRSSRGLGGTDPAVDIVVATPANLGPLGLSPKNIDLFADVKTLVVDEADMLLDGGYVRQLENVLLGFRRADKLDPSLGVEKTQRVFVAATLPDAGLRSVDAYLRNKFPNARKIAMDGMHNARHYGLRERTLWIEDEEDGGGNRGRMERLAAMLKDGELKGEKVMIFLNSVDDVDGATNALRRAGINAVPYHAKIPLSERTNNLDLYRRYTAGESDDDGDDEDDAAPILVCTDLASRGLDVPGVTAIVQLQFATNVVAHLHRMGRCGRAGNRTGRGVVFYDPLSREGELAEVVKEAERVQERMVLRGDVQEDLEGGDDDEEEGAGKVGKAFSRKRGFTKKRKKMARDRREVNIDGGGDD